MPTLFNTYTGFRFPYQKWAETSTPQNLQFMETLVTEHLHYHEDDGTTLWVTPAGFRLPHLKSHENFEDNMKYIEHELGEYLHEHEVVTNYPPSSQDWLPGYDIGGFEGTTIGVAHADGWWRTQANAGTPTAAIVAGGADGGTSYVHVSGGGVDDPINLTLHLSFGTAANTPVQTLFGGDITLTGWSFGSAETGETMFFEIDVYDVNDTFLFHRSFQNDPYLNAAPGWEPFSVTFNLLDSGVPEATGFVLQVTFVGQNLSAAGANMGFDGLQVFESTGFAGGEGTGAGSEGFPEPFTDGTLVTTHVGFRFPYAWHENKAMKENIRWLQDQMTRFLHKHEVKP